MDILAESISYKYFRKGKKKEAIFELLNISLELKEGELTGIIGHSGSGKSTLLNILSGALTPVTGTVKTKERGDISNGYREAGIVTDLYSLNDRERSRFRNRHIGIIPQDRSALGHLTVYENIILPLKMYGEMIPEKYTEKIISDLGLERVKREPAASLSGGEVRRLSVARALIGRPEIILADEPTGDLDQDNRRVVLEILKQLSKEGKTVLMVTHDKEAESYADRIYRIENGEVISDQL